MNPRRGRPPGSKEPQQVEQVMDDSLSTEPGTIVVMDGTLEFRDSSETLTNIPKLDAVAFSVVRNGDLYQLVKIPFGVNSFSIGIPEVIFENTDRWEVQSQFVYETENAFLVVEDL